MLQAADALVAVTTESEDGKVGGAGHFCGLASARELPMVVIDPASGEVRESRMECFAERGCSFTVR